MPAHPPREGQGSKHSWLLADNPAPDGTATSSAGFLCRSPAERAQTRVRGISHQGFHTAAASPCAAVRTAAPLVCRWWAASGLRHTACSHAASRKHGRLENIHLQALRGLDRMQHPTGLPGSHLAPSKMEGDEARYLESGKGQGRGTQPLNIVCWTQDLEPGWPCTPSRICALSQLGMSRAGGGDCH